MTQPDLMERYHHHSIYIWKDKKNNLDGKYLGSDGYAKKPAMMPGMDDRSDPVGISSVSYHLTP